MTHRFPLFLILLLLSAFTITSTTNGENKENEDPLFSFGMVADVQYCDCEPHNNRYYRNSLKKFREAVEHFNERDLEFVVSVGDIIDKQVDSFGPVKTIADGLNVPFYHVLGNHDFPYPENKYEQVLETLQMERNYYDYSISSYRFLVLDGNDLSLLAREEGEEEYAKAEEMLQELENEGAANANNWNGGIGNRQLTWLRETLEQADAAGETVIVFNHFPVYPPAQHNLWNDGELVEVLEQYDHVTAIINGHNHAGDYEYWNGIHYITLKGMVETPDSSAYAIVEVYSDRLELTGFGREPSRVMEY